MAGTNTFKAAFLITGEVGSTFRKAMSGAEKDTNILKTQLTSLQRTLSRTESFEKSRHSLQAQTTKFYELKAATQALGAQLAATTTPSKKLQTQFEHSTMATERARVALREHIVALEKDEAELKKAGVDTKNLTTEQTRIQQQLELTNKKLERVDSLKGAVGKLGASFRRVKDDVIKATVAVVGFTAAAYGIYRFTESAAEFSASATEIGASLGMTATELQQVRYGALQSGIAIEDTDEAIGKMIKTTRMARDQYSAVGKSFLRLGLDARAMSFASPKMQLELLAHAFSKVKSERERAEIGQQIFGGKDGPRMAALLAQGADKWTASQRKALEVGYALSSEENERAEQAKKNMQVFEARMTGLKNRLAAELLPAVSDALASVGEFFTKNRAQITQFGHLLGGVIREALPVLLQFAKAGLSIASAIGSVMRVMPGWVKWLAVAGSLMAAGGVAAGIFAFHLGSLVYSAVGVGRILGLWIIRLPAVISLLRMCGVAVLGVGRALATVLLNPIVLEFAALAGVVIATAYALTKLISLMIEIHKINAIGKESGKAADSAEHREALLRRQKGIKPVTEREKRIDRELDESLSSTGSAQNRSPATGSSSASGPRLAPSRSHLTQHNEIHVHPPAGLHPAEIAKQIMAHLDRKQRDAERLGPSGFAYA